MSPPEKQLSHVTSGSSLIGEIASVIHEVNHDTIEGDVRIKSELYSARAYDNVIIKTGAKVEVVESSGVHLVVREIPEGSSKKMTNSNIKEK